MKIIRPYGSSRTMPGEGKLERKLIESHRTRDPEPRDIPEFAGRRSELVIGQWISLIDKTACKPNGTSRPTPAQREFRDGLEQACRKLLFDPAKNYLPEGRTEDQRALALTLWLSRMHPYPEGTKEAKLKDGKLPAWAKVEGRFYGAFAGKSPPHEADCDDIARRIEARLYGREERAGLIAARAESIKINVLRPQGAEEPKPRWTDNEIGAYRAQDDPAQRIRARAEAIEKAGDRMNHGEAAAILHGHWPKVFLGADGAVLSVSQARDRSPGLLALHDQLRLCYRGLLKRTRKDTRQQRKDATKTGKQSHPLSIILPRDLDEALGRLGQRSRNAELSELVRLGKVIHYSAPRQAGDADHPGQAIANWPQGWKTGAGGDGGEWLRGVEASRYWTSEAQAEIKRAEAFVRMWRQALVLARWTLTDWVSMKVRFRKDILGGDGQVVEALQPDLFERKPFDRKLNLLFGVRSPTFDLPDDATCRAFLHGLIDGAAQLRHASFHFKGRKDLLDALNRLPDDMQKRLPHDMKNVPMTVAAALWQADAKGRIVRLRETLEGVQAEAYLTQEQADRILPLLAKAEAVELPLPRFSRILDRRKNAWASEGVRLPQPAHRVELEAKPERRCQYTIMKLVYERPFRVWFDGCQSNQVQAWIDRAVKRANLAAQELHGKGKSDAAKALIAARADRLKGLVRAGDRRHPIAQFFSELSRESASEMRIQRGYESDAAAAREQAEYVEDLLCDAVILAFDAYLKEAQLDWLRHIGKRREAPCKLPPIESSDADLAAEDWQRALYLILHLIPVESVGQLLHQLFRWNIAAGGAAEEAGDAADYASKVERNRLDGLFKAMTLYLDMHDAKFTGDMAFAGCEEFRRLFQPETGFDKVFPTTLDEKDERRLPRRGLREIARFGHLPVIETLCGGVKIKNEKIDAVFAMEEAGGDSKIARLQHEREGLHKTLVKQKKDQMAAKDLEDYCRAVAAISAHREASNFVNLIDHVRVHRIIMAVWSRLVDYAGLFERDVYFVTLALMHHKGQSPAGLLEADGVDLLSRGQTISALFPKMRKHVPNSTAFSTIDALFDDIWKGNAPLRIIRNNLAHLDLRGQAGASSTPRLTDWINDARRLMGYDRKMKNVIPKSVIDLMARHGIDLFWSIPEGGTSHALTKAKLTSRCATHLGEIKLNVRDRGFKDRALLNERLLSDGCVKMLAAAFGGEAQRKTSIAETLDRIDWEATVAKPK